MPDKIWFLRRLNLFEGMGEEEMTRVSRELRMRRCSPHQPVFEGEAERVYLLKEGRVRLYQLSEDGQEVTTAVVVPGQLFGLGSLFGGDAYASHAEALEPSVICDAGAHDFLAMLARHPLLMARVMMVMARQIFLLEQTIESMALQPVAGRLAQLLLDMAADGNGNGVQVPAISHDEMAKIIRSSRESVSRTLAVWRREGLIRNRGRRIVIVSREGLTQVARRTD